MDMSLSKLRELVMDREPGVLRFMGLQRAGHDWATELNWTKASFLVPFVVLHCAPCGILAPWPVIEPAPASLEGGVLTTGPLEKSLDYSFIHLCFHLSFLLLMGIFLSWPYFPAPSLCLNHLFILLKPEGRIQTQVFVLNLSPCYPCPIDSFKLFLHV